MSQDRNRLAPFRARMAAAGLDPLVIDTFAHYYTALVDGQTGLIREADILPVEALPDAETFGADLTAAGRQALAATVLLKLNGGLGTGMGLNRAKSLLPVREGLTFLDIIARQARHSRIPLVLMDSFSTQADSLAALAAYPDLVGEIPLDFLQNKVPKINADDFTPAEFPADPDLAWCPPGHGDLYTAMITSGMLTTLLAAGYRYAFVSNADNLGAVIDPALLGYFVSKKLPFMMEAADRTEADRKGGHLACLPGGQLILREAAQCPVPDEATFQDISRHRYFNTNNLWLDLTALASLMAARRNFLGLSMICNRKTVDPRDPASRDVFQLETAMGSALAVFPGAGAVRVPPTRFAPIKKTSDLLDVRSDNYILTTDFQVVANPARTLGRAFIDLDPGIYKLVDALEERFPHGSPGLLACERLTVRGDFEFGRDVVVQGRVDLVNPGPKQQVIPDGTVLTGDGV